MNKLFFLAAILALSSCSLLPNRMFKTPKEYSFAQDTTDKLNGPYIIQSDDKIDLHIFSNDGFKLVDITSSNLSSTANTEGIEYNIEANGEAKLPVIGRVLLRGLNITEAENLLQEKYSKFYNEPFVLIRVVSRRALVFLGDDGKGIVVPLQNDHTTLFEALALAGGITQYSKSYEIRIVRGDLKNPQVYHADISSVEGLKNSELRVYPNDIIYVDATKGIGRRISTEFLPYFTMLSSVLILMTYFKN